MLLERRSPISVLFSTLLFAVLLLAANSAIAMEKERIVPMGDYFRQETPLYPAHGNTPAAVETTIRHQVFFTDLDGSTAGWGLVNFRAGQPNAWHTVTGGSHACVGTSWWMGQTGLAHGDGYDNNWVQALVTNVPINVAGTTGNKLTFKMKFQAEYGYDWGWVLIRGSNPGSRWDTLASYSGDFGASCVNQTIDVPDSFAT
ncbi:MAG TPA: hypothetical protein VFU59_00385, partial [Candidatus Eisenbacteria bacterium]|nr:hypothetical protein [Candidatus Eisenbacteria bacterium]